jgi:hypothetical protein
LVDVGAGVGLTVLVLTGLCSAGCLATPGSGFPARADVLGGALGVGAGAADVSFSAACAGRGDTDGSPQAASGTVAITAIVPAAAI